MDAYLNALRQWLHHTQLADFMNTSNWGWPIAESVLNKYLGTVRQSRPEVFENVALKSDGALDEVAVERNLARLAPDRRRPAFVDALNELLYSELLAVKRTLGPDHETALVRELRPPR